MAKMDFDKSWEGGPPKSDVESWNYNRRCEATNIASQIASIMGAGKAKEGWDSNNPETFADAEFPRF
jgi:hypothetical protein